MKKKLLPITLFLLSINSFAQVGIGTDNPNTSTQLDVYSDNKGLLIPRVALVSTTDATTIENGNVNSLLVFNTATSNDITPGYYYWYVDKWYRIVNNNDLNPETLTSLTYNEQSNTLTYKDEAGANNDIVLRKEQFYAPSIVLPTTPDGVSTDSSDQIYYTPATETYTIKLYSIYDFQFGMQGDVAGTTRSAIRSNSSSNLRKYTASELDYFVIYFDNTVFDPETITISTDGIMTYKIVPNSTVTEKTFINVVYKVK